MTIFDTVSQMMTETEAVMDAYIAFRDALSEDEYLMLTEKYPHLDHLLDCLADLESTSVG